MLTLFWVFALTGTLILIIQMILHLIGIGDDSDVDMDADADVDFEDIGGGMDFPFFTLKSVTGFVGGFGWGGLIILKYNNSSIMALAVGFGLGIVLSLSVSTLLYLLSKLKHSGNLNIRNAVGKIGTVYLLVPENRKGTGVVHVIVQDSLREFKAMSEGKKIPTGRRIKIIKTEENVVIVEELVNK
jgi:membrane-bound ClpP family serine protease